MNKGLLLSICLPILMIFIGGIGLSEPQLPSDNSKIQPCTEPLTWRIGRLDSLFEIDQEDLKRTMTEAGNLWSEAVNKKLLAYSDSGEIALNLIYSEKQKWTMDEQRLSDQINEMKLKYYAYKIEYQKLENNYDLKIKNYNRALGKYEQFVKEYKRMMSRWSSKAVVPKDVDDNLKDIRKNIEYWQTQEEIELNNLNTHIREMQQLSSELNEFADEVNEMIHVYNKQFSERQTFHQGVYIKAGDQKKINIYQFEDLDKLRLVLAHEIGHALGLNHVGNPKSVMYFLMGNQNTRNLKLSDEDKRAIMERCGIPIN